MSSQSIEKNCTQVELTRKICKLFANSQQICWPRRSKRSDAHALELCDMRIKLELPLTKSLKLLKNHSQRDWEALQSQNMSPTRYVP